MYKHRRATLTSEKLIKKRRRRLRIFLVTLLGFAVILATILFFVLRAPFLQITTVVVEGNEAIDTENIQSIAESVLNEQYLWVIPKRNRLLYPKETIEAKIRMEIGRIESISLHVEEKALYIKIGERDSYALWCKEEANCYFIDRNGLVFSKAPVFSHGVYKTFTGVLVDAEPVGKQFLDSDKIAGIELVASFLKELGWSTQNIEVRTLRDVLLVQDKGPAIKIDLTKNFESTKAILKTLITSEEFKKSAKDITAVEYIDARFGSKVFFRPKNSVLPASAIAPAL